MSVNRSIAASIGNRNGGQTLETGDRPHAHETIETGDRPWGETGDRPWNPGKRKRGIGPTRTRRQQDSKNETGDRPHAHETVNGYGNGNTGAATADGAVPCGTYPEQTRHVTDDLIV